MVNSYIDWSDIDSNVEVIDVKSGCCNEACINTVDLRRFHELREFIVGDECFMHVKKVIISDLSMLEKVTIGEFSFSAKEGNGIWFTSDISFFLRDCPSLKELSIGDCSFIEYSTCIIENVPSIHTISIGGLCWRRWHGCFIYSSIELRGR